MRCVDMCVTDPRAGPRPRNFLKLNRLPHTEPRYCPNKLAIKCHQYSWVPAGSLKWAVAVAGVCGPGELADTPRARFRMLLLMASFVCVYLTVNMLLEDIKFHPEI